MTLQGVRRMRHFHAHKCDEIATIVDMKTMSRKFDQHFGASRVSLVGPDIASRPWVVARPKVHPVGVARGRLPMLVSRHLTQHTPR